MPELETSETAEKALGFDEAFDEAFNAARDSETTEEEQPVAEEKEPVETEASESETEDDLETQESEEMEEVADSDAETTDEDDLLSKDEYDAVKDDPEALRKALNRAYTQKTQRLAEERKQVQAYANLIQSFESDPQGTLKLLAKEYGLQLRDTAQTEQQVTDGVDSDVEELKAVLGEDLAKQLGPVFQTIASRAAERALQPYQQQVQERMRMEAETKTKETIATFTKRHPGWERHEDAMMKIAQNLQPKGMAEIDYMELLWREATRDVSAAETAKRTVARIQKSAKAAQESHSGVSDKKVSPRAPRDLSLDEALERGFEAAKSGIRYEE